jgi:similar to stage IV sporulation protein
MVIGALCFCVLTYFLSDVVFALEFSGSGSIYKNQVMEFLEQNGVEKYSLFSKIDLKTLEDAVLASNDRLSFVGMERRGNRLEVELVLSSDKVQTLDGNVHALYSDVSGIIESVKVYRGTAVVKVGDNVNKGDLLVDGYVVLKENTIKINVLCAVSVIAEETLEYFSEKDGEEEKAELFAQMQTEDKDVLASQTIKIPKDNGYLYIVNVKYRRTLYAG